MTRGLLVVVGLLGLWWALGCRQDSEPSPRFADQPGAYGVPIQVFARVGDRSVVASAQPEDAPASKTGKSAPAATEGKATPTDSKGKIDDSSPEAVAQALSELSATDDLASASLVELLVPEQQEPMRQLVEVLQPVSQLLQQLRKTIAAKFPGQGGSKGPASETSGPGKMTVSSVKVDPNNKEQAVATLQTPSGVTQTRQLVRVGSHWRVRLDQVLRPEDIAKIRQGTDAGRESIRKLIGQVESGQFPTRAAAEQAAGPVVLGVVFGIVAVGAKPSPNRPGQPPAQDKPVSAPPTPDKPPAAAAATGKPAGAKNAQREEVDDVISGPTVRHRP